MGQIHIRKDLFYPRVFELTMVRPNIICIEIHDPAITQGLYLKLTNPPDPGNYDQWLSRNNPARGGLPDRAQLMGRFYDHLRFQDLRPQRYFQQENAQVAVNYGMVGPRTVVAVHYQNDLETKGFWNSDGWPVGQGIKNSSTQFRHFIYLELDGALPNGGPYTINFPENTLVKPYTFTFNDKITRTSSLSVSHIDWRSTDKGKMAVVLKWVPSLSPGGAVSFDDVPTFHIINNVGAIVYTGNVVKTRAHTDRDAHSPWPINPWGGGGNQGLTYYADFSQPHVLINSIIPGNPGKFVVPVGHGIVNDQRIVCGESTVSGVSFGVFMAKNVEADRFDVYSSLGTPTSISGTVNNSQRQYGHSNRFWPAVTQNYARTNTYWCEFGDWTPTNGTYYIYLPGIGVSYPMNIHNDCWLDLAKATAKGFYHKSQGRKLDGRFGFTREVSIRDGQNGVMIFKGRIPYPFQNEDSQQSLVNSNVPARYDSWLIGVPPERIDMGGEFQDAGDWDQFFGTHTAISYICGWFIDKYGAPAMAAIDFNWPLSSDPNNFLNDSDYAELDGLPNIVHLMVWPLAMYLRTQEGPGSPLGDGAIWGGIQGNAQYGNYDEPSPEDTCRRFAFLPDHRTTYQYSGYAANVGRILVALGATTLGMKFYNSAKRAYAWSKDIDDKLNPSIVTLIGGAGSYLFGETVTTGTGSAVITQAGSTTIRLRMVSGSFSNGQTLTGATSLAARPIQSVAGINPLYTDSQYYYRDNTEMTRVKPFTADMTIGNNTLTNVTNIADIRVGDQIVATGITSTNAVASINVGANTITLRNSQNSLIRFDGTFITTNTTPVVTAAGTGVAMVARLRDAGFSEQVFTAAVMTLQNGVGGARTIATGMLSKAVEAIEGAAAALPYRQKFEATWDSGDGQSMYGRYEYMTTLSANPTLRDTIKAGFNNNFINPSVGGIIPRSTGLDKTFPIWTFGWFLTSVMGPVGNATSTFNMGPVGIEEHSNAANRVLGRSSIQRGLAFIHGMNWPGQSYMAGFGHRPVKNQINIDCTILGPYGGQTGQISFGPGGFSFGLTPAGGFNIWGGPNISQNSMRDVAASASDVHFENRKVVYPLHTGFPGLHHWDCQDIIAESEDGTPALVACFFLSLWLHFNPEP